LQHPNRDCRPRRRIWTLAVLIGFACLLSGWSAPVAAGAPPDSAGSLDLTPGDLSQARDALREVGKAANDSKQFAEVIRRGTELLHTLGERARPAARADVLVIVGEAWYKLGDHEKALEHLLRGLELAELTRDREIELRAMGYVGFIHRDQKNHDKAVEQFTRAAELARKVGKTNYLTAAINEIGNVYYFQGQYEKALEIKYQALAIAREARLREPEAYCLNDLGDILSKLGRHPEALERFVQAEKLLSGQGRERELAFVLNSQASELVHLGRAQEAAELAGQVIEQARATGIRDLLADSLETLARAEAAGGRHAEAFAALRESNTVRGQLFDERGSRRIAELQVRFDLERKERQIRELEDAHAINSLRLSRERLLRYAAVGGLLLLGALAFLVFNRYRLSVKARRALQAAHDEIHAKNQELHDANVRLERAALHDALTGLLNRRGMMERIELERIRYMRSQKPFSVVLGDIDFFKSINDRHGHQVGDHVLSGVARVIGDGVRRQDASARWGGEEFLILLPETELAGALTVAEKIRARIEEHAFEAGGGRVPVTMTFGVAQWDPAGSIDACTRQADEALYEGKRGGRNRVVLAPVEPAPEDRPPEPEVTDA